MEVKIFSVLFCCREKFFCKELYIYINLKGVVVVPGRKNIETTIPYLRAISYGCYHRMQFKHFNLNQRTYDDVMTLFNFALSEENTTSKWHNGKVIHFRSDKLYGSENCLILIFYTKNLSAETCFHYILLLTILYNSSEPLKWKEILNKAHESINKCLNTEDSYRLLDHDVTLLYRRFKELSKEGLIKAISQNKVSQYQLTENPLSDLNETEVAELIQAISFYQYVSIMELPGAFLCQTLKDMYPTEKSKKIFRFKNNNFTRIFNEPTIGFLLDAINKREYISFRNKRNKKETQNISQPLQIQNDYNYHRQYVVFYDKKHGIKRSRLENLKHLKFHEEPPGNPASINSINILEKNQRSVQLKIKYSSESERNKIINKLREYRSEINIKESSFHILEVIVTATDLWQIIPWLRTFFPNLISVEEDSGNLKRKMQQDIEETLKNYGY